MRLRFRFHNALGVLLWLASVAVAWGQPRPVTTVHVEAPLASSTHPRIWLTAGILADIVAKKNAGDADWVTFRNQVDTDLTKTLPICTPTAVSNANPAVVTCAETIPFNPTSSIYLAGGTGNWAGLNTKIVQGGFSPWCGTRVTATTMSLRLYASDGSCTGATADSTTYGSFAGQAVNLFIFDDAFLSAGTISWGQYGFSGGQHGYSEAVSWLALMYQMCSASASGCTNPASTYSTKALAVLDLLNTYGAAGNTGPQSIDGGRAGAFNTVNLAQAFDWLYPVLSPAQKTATVVTLNLWGDWSTVGVGGTGPAFSLTDPTSNYWEGTNSYIAAVGYATFDDNVRAQSWIDLANTTWANQFVRTFDPPSTSVQPYDNKGQGMFYGGGNTIGWNYGGNDIGRHLKYGFMVKSATGSDKASLVAWAKLWAGDLMYELKPDRFKSTTWGRWTGNYYGVMNHGEDMILSAFLDSTTEGGWAQWLYQHITYGGGVDANQFQANLIDRFLWYKASRPQVDYTATQPTYKFVDGTAATVFWRDGWGTSAQAMNFRASPASITSATGESIAKDAGHLDITRGTDYLLVQSAMWKGVTDGLTGAPEILESNAALASTLYFWDGDNGNANNGTGNCFDRGIGSAYDGCQLLYALYKQPVVKLTSSYGFAMNDFASAYQNNAGIASRTLSYFFRSVIILAGGNYIVCDRVRSTKSEDRKQLRWHFPATNTPTVTAGTTGLVTTTIGASKLYVTTLLPASPSLQVVRNQATSNWHVEVADPTPAQTFVGLTAFYATASGGSLPTTSPVTTIDTNFVGVLVADATPQIAIFPKTVTDGGAGVYTSPTLTACTYNVSYAGTGHHVIAGLAAGTYTIRLNGSTIASGQVVGSDTTLEFTAAAGTIAVS